MAGHVGAADLAEADVRNGAGIEAAVEIVQASLTGEPVQLIGQHADDLIEVIPGLLHLTGVGGSGLGSSSGNGLLLLLLLKEAEGGDGEDNEEDETDEDDGVRHDRLLDEWG